MTGKPRRRRRADPGPSGRQTTPATDPAPGDSSDLPAEAAVAALLADPDSVRQRLATDLAAVAATGRGEVRVDPSLPAEQLVLAVREQAHRLGFGSPTVAVVEAGEHADELPVSEREAAGTIEAYHHSAGRTVLNGEVVRELPRSDGTSLVFHRQAAEPQFTSIRTEAVVGISSGGTAHLVGYGWPTVVTERPVHTFGGSPEGYAEQLVADLRRAAESGTAGNSLTGDAVDPTARAYFSRAMLMALGFVIAAHRDGQLPADRLVVYQHDVARLVATSAPLLVDYLEGAFDSAEQGGMIGWTTACVRRSGVEGLFAGFLGSASFELMDADVLIDLHRVIDAAAEALGRVGKAPEGLPRSHDWWVPGRGW